MTERSTLVKHDCGLCDGPIVPDTVINGEQWYVCTLCDWQHCERDCCA